MYLYLCYTVVLPCSKAFILLIGNDIVPGLLILPMMWLCLVTLLMQINENFHMSQTARDYKLTLELGVDSWYRIFRSLCHPSYNTIPFPIFLLFCWCVPTVATLRQRYSQGSAVHVQRWVGISQHNITKVWYHFTANIPQRNNILKQKSHQISNPSKKPHRYMNKTCTPFSSKSMFFPLFMEITIRCHILSHFRPHGT